MAVIGLAAVAVAGLAGTVGWVARGEAHDRCEMSAPPFPYRVIATDVDWQPLSLRYDCEYTLRRGAEITLEPCPEGMWRQPGLRSCGRRRPP